MKSQFSQFKGRMHNHPDDISIWITSLNGFAKYVACKPKFKPGTISYQIRSILSKSKKSKTVSVSEIVERIMKVRKYSNVASATRSTSRVLYQLVNWNCITPNNNTPVGFVLKKR